LCRSFIYKDDAKPPRVYPSILGCLVRKHFPGFVSMPSGGESIAWTWRHYSYAPDPEGILDNTQQRVLHDFWVSFFDFSSFKNSEVDCICTNGFVPFLSLCILVAILCPRPGSPCSMHVCGSCRSTEASPRHALRGACGLRPQLVRRET
jgi:hypothetical protein